MPATAPDRGGRPARGTPCWSDETSAARDGTIYLVRVCPARRYSPRMDVSACFGATETLELPDRRWPG